MLISTGLWLLASSAGAWAGASVLQPTPLQTGNEARIPGFNLSAGLNQNEFGPFCFDQKVSHLEDVNGTFCQRFSVSSELYRPGGPVLLRVSGETATYGNGSVFQGGFEYHIAKETGALVVWLEHRYYGYSYPEALEDTANFIRNFQLPKSINVTDPSGLKYDRTPWILYSWSYPGALVAWMRGKYPDLVWASIASSATIDRTTEHDGLLYMTAAGKWGNPACIKPLEEAWTAIDAILDRNDMEATNELKAFFDLSGVPDWRFAAIGYDTATAWQSRAWDLPSNSWERFCKDRQVKNDNVTIGGVPYPGALATFRNTQTMEGFCPNGTTGQACLDAMGDPMSLSVPPKMEIGSPFAQFRTWQYQCCSEYGPVVAGPPAGSDLPRIASKYFAPEGWYNLCRHWYPPGEKNKLPDTLPTRSVIDEMGRLNYTAPRIAWVAGEYDPWGPSIKQKQESTPDNPFYLIPKGGHAWDAFALQNLFDEPDFMQTVHRGLLADVSRWVKEFHNQSNATGTN